MQGVACLHAVLPALTVYGVVGLRALQGGLLGAPPLPSCVWSPGKNMHPTGQVSGLQCKHMDERRQGWLIDLAA